MGRQGISEHVHVSADLDALSCEAAEHIVRVVAKQAQGSGWVSIALGGGSTIRRLYKLLAGASYRHRLPWDRVRVFWGDERCVPPDDPASNFGLAWQLLLSKVPVPSANLYRVPTERGDSASVSAAYEATLRKVFGLQAGDLPVFTLILLGLGSDGHTASLFPHSTALRQSHRLVTETTGGHPDVSRVTLTAPVLNHANEIMWLVAGTQKASVVHAVLEGPEQRQELPAQYVRPSQGASHWFIDRAAAQRLSMRASR